MSLLIQLYTSQQQLSAMHTHRPLLRRGPPLMASPSWSLHQFFRTRRTLCHLFFFFLMIRRPPRPPLFPSPPLFRSRCPPADRRAPAHRVAPVHLHGSPAETDGPRRCQRGITLQRHRSAGEVQRRPRRRVERAVAVASARSEEHTSELQSRLHLVYRLLLDKKIIPAKYKRAVSSLYYHTLLKTLLMASSVR